MTDHGRHIAVLGIAVLVVGMGGAVAIVAAFTKNCDHDLFMVALGIVGAGSSIVAAEFGLARSSPQRIEPPAPMPPITERREQP